MRDRVRFLCLVQSAELKILVSTSSIIRFENIRLVPCSCGFLLWMQRKGGGVVCVNFHCSISTYIATFMFGVSLWFVSRAARL